MSTENIYNAIEQTFKMNKMLLTEDFIHEYLNSRDFKDFDGKWADAYEHVKNISLNAHLSNKEFLVQDSDLRKRVFKNVVSISGGYELAEYVSDDAGLIYANLFFNVSNSFIDYVYHCYKKNVLPN